MKYDHAFAPDNASGHRCRLCATNDLDGLIEEIAAAMWESVKLPDAPEQHWGDASDYWQATFRGYARGFVDVVKR